MHFFADSQQSYCKTNIKYSLTIRVQVYVWDGNFSHLIQKFNPRSVCNFIPQVTQYV